MWEQKIYIKQARKLGYAIATSEIWKHYWLTISMSKVGAIASKNLSFTMQVPRIEKMSASRKNFFTEAKVVLWCLLESASRQNDFIRNVCAQEADTICNQVKKEPLKVLWIF